MRKHVKIIAGCVLSLVIGIFAGWMSYEHLISFFTHEEVQIAFIDLSQVFFTKVKVSVLFGLIGPVVFWGTVVPEKMNALFRFLLIAVPTSILCGITAAVRRAIIARWTELTDFPHNIMLTLDSVRIELIPVSGLIAAVAISLLIYLPGNRQLPSMGR